MHVKVLSAAIPSVLSMTVLEHRGKMAHNIAPKLNKPKRQRKRKARTEVSSDSSSSSSDSSSSDESDASTAPSKTVQKKTTKTRKITSTKSQDSSSDAASEQDKSSAIAQQADDAKAEEAFDNFYLRQMTTEFAEDLDKVRAAGDFSNKSIPMLVEALKQGRSCFDKDVRLSVGRQLAQRDA